MRGEIPTPRMNEGDDSGILPSCYLTGRAFGTAEGIGPVALGMEEVEPPDVAGAPLFLENSAVLLRYQISAPPPMTATKVKKTSRMPRQDFMRVFKSNDPG
jgi:hypothetical protein